MDFEKQKKIYCAELSSGKPDKSKKGFIDEEVKELITAINTLPNYYTTSSCAGRILIYSTSKEQKKNQTQWLFTSHKKVTYEEIEPALYTIPDTLIFLRFEPLIIHVACKDLPAAEKFLSLCHNAGLKHSGIISISKRIIIEVIGHDLLDAPIAKGKMLVSKEWFLTALDDANAKMQRNQNRIEKLKLIVSSTK
ncbi:MAG: tRNA wybutosine-synthesizing 3 family protein [Candidatus Woesearchaeota archaeon]|jgi:tRNA wybutosine-synthesizing protein 3